MNDDPRRGAAFDATLAVQAGDGRPPLARGASLGRYVVLDVLGSGGVGVVYAAYDPELDRRVAIKLLHARGPREQTSEGRGRLLREAQAIARIAHPNVVGVHDVGTFGDEIFIAMEYVEGRTLRAWLDEEPRTREAILEMYVQAGRGLAAAHAKGLVHRDFKPENVLVGADGRARVVDFGLARADDAVHALSETLPAHSESLLHPPASSSALDTPLTQTGELMGTPLYMAPEQFRGRATDARTDQYSFSVALLEALHGQHPIAQANDIPSLSVRVTRGELRPDPADRKLPARLRRTLARAMAVDANDRFASMDDLLAELAPRKSRWGWPVATALGVAVVGAGVWIARRPAATEAAVCAGSEGELQGTWDAGRKSAMAAAFQRSTKPYAGDALRAASDALDAYAGRWTKMHESTCVATRVKGVQSEELLDLRMACLRQRRHELRSLVTEFTSADDTVIERAPQAALSLSDLDACADVTALRAPAPPPRDPAVRARIDQVREQLAEGHALEAAGKYAELVARAEGASHDAAAIGYAPLQAEALLELGRARSFAKKDLPGASDALFDAVVAAEAGRNDHAAAAAWIELTRVRAYRVAFPAAHESDRLAAAAIERLGGDDTLTARREHVLGQLLDDEGRYEEAIARFHESLDRTIRVFGESHPEVAVVLDSSGYSLTQLGRYDEAIAMYRRALGIRERELGRDHPRVAATLQNLSLAYGDKGDFASALEYSRRAVDIKERALGHDHPDMAPALVDVGNALDGLGRFDEAVANYLRALALRERTMGPDSPTTAVVLFDLAQSYLEQGRASDALPYAQRALAIREKAYGPAHPEVSEALTSLAQVMCATGHFAEAAPLAQRALTIAEKSVGPEHVQAAEALRTLGEARLGSHDAAHAVADLERACALFHKLDEAPAQRAECDFALAQALWQSGGDRARSATLAEQARVAYVAAGPQSARYLAEVTAWQRGHGP